MFKRVGRIGSADGISPEALDSDDDISLTSSVGDKHDPDAEFSVEQVLAEEVVEGDTVYLVEWVGFPMEESTWEPEENLGDELREIWEETKRKHATGEGKPFDVANWYRAVRKREREKAKRHYRRNAKRRKLGLPLTEPLSDDSPTESSDEEAVEEDLYVDDRVTASTSPKPGLQDGQNSVRATTKPSSMANKSSAPMSKHTKSQSETPQLDTTKKSATTGNGSSSKKPSASSSREPPERRSSTGYQGTAKKPTAIKHSTLTATTNNPPKPATTSRVANPIAPSLTPPVNGNPKRVLTAKKSKVGKAGTNNIFVAGKKKKPRVSLKEAILAEKRGRDKEDIAADPSTLSLFPISAEPTASTGIRKLSKDILPPTPTVQQSPPAELKRAIIKPYDDGPTRKKRKSVRFEDDEHLFMQEPEPMDIDTPGSPIRQKDLPGRPRLRSLSPPPMSSTENFRPIPKKLSFTEYRTKALTQTSVKKLVFGDSVAVEATFSGLPRDSPQPWLASFLAQETFQFRYTCFATAFRIQSESLIQARLCDGTITTKDNEPILEGAAEYLRSGLLGLYFPHPNFNVIVFPSKCEEWKIDLVGQEPASPSGVELRYLLFLPNMDIPALSRPLDLPFPARNTESNGLDIKHARERVVTRLFDLNYAKLLPVLPKPPEVHNFFLAFPEPKGATMVSLFHWLRACNPECQIYLCHHPGSWTAFRASVIHQSGVVIVHETLAWSLRRFPRLSRYLINNHDQYWCFSDPIQTPLLYPSITLPDTILLTPSFLISEPQRAYEFLDWFLTRWGKSFNYRLVTAYNIHEYMMDLAVEKSRARDDLWNNPRGTELEFQIDANLRGVSHDDCNFRYLSATLAMELHNLRTLRAGPYAVEEEDMSSLVYADSSIDPNDEQSLINWFGWWSSLRVDQFRKFHVVGSSQSINFQGSKRGERRVRIPTYSKDTVNDPDAVSEALQKRFDTLEQAAVAEEASRCQVNTASTENQKSNGSLKPSWSFQSDIIPSDEFRHITGVLFDISMQSNSKSVWTLYRMPISWTDSNMALHFGDWKEDFKKISDWFKFTWSFVNPSYNSPVSFNTYVGFFHTIAEEWDHPQNPPQECKGKPKRHPWLAIYRPVNPHHRPYDRCELIIWDLAARARFPGSKVPAMKDLIYMQRQVIQHVHEHGPVKNPGTWLDQVWLGGFNYPADCESPYPFDTTVNFLNRMLQDLKEFLPAPEKQMYYRGYRKSEDTRIIFHPPRGKLQPGRRSNCTNKLYETARLARAGVQVKDSQYMKFTFPNTMEWYEEQRAEGRGFEHINVDSWESIFNLFKIGKSAVEFAGNSRDSTASA
ncbi:hypothetical protein B0T17DRAFT_622620 [Bombardia bombarda]|uniref:Chromo domain-containing protein n=1 Tax=Bombardia bombarda TaxID=252184 RepID=A0AA40CEQ2_9PEZI|nr:hypothetical protein B0T17DRAFT_622620 [Bombardia bombarda]